MSRNRVLFEVGDRVRVLPRYEGKCVLSRDGSQGRDLQPGETGTIAKATYDVDYPGDDVYIIRFEDGAETDMRQGLVCSIVPFNGLDQMLDFFPESND